MQGNIEHTTPLTIESVSRIHFRGGSHIGISRANPTKDPALLENTVISLLRLNVSQLITIGGDDTAFSAMKLEQKSQGRIRVVHVPKTIDNDLDLPPYVDTFGYQTARHYGVEIVKNLMVDAKTTSRWYLVIAMGRKAGHLALGIGKSAGSTLTMIPEEFTGHPVRLKAMVDTLAGAIIKRLSYGRRDGVAIIAEGLVLDIDPADLSQLEEVERDAHGHIRIAEVNIGEILKSQVTKRLKEFGLKATLVAKNIGYELRCADPVPADMEYTRDLGYCAAKYLLSGGNGVMISMQGGHFVPIPFEQLLDPATGRTKVRLVDVHSTRYAIARRYMIRLRRDDFNDPHELAKFAATGGMSLSEFRRQFEYLVHYEPPPLHLDAGMKGFLETEEDENKEPTDPVEEAEHSHAGGEPQG
jgi:6-phosphofructokinase 1